MTKAHRKECQGNSQSSPNLIQLFGSKAKGSQPTTGHETQPAPATPPRLEQTTDQMSPPAPKKLRFTASSSKAPATLATASEAHALAAAAESPEGAEEEAPEADPIQVDFF